MLTLAITGAYLAESSPARSEDLQDAMHRLGLQSALVVQSQAVDEHPVWSPTGDALAVNIEGKWMSVPLRSMTLTEGKWRGGLPIGVPRPSPTMSEIDAKTVRDWKKAGTYDPRRVRTKDGTVVELKQEELSTEFLITRKGEPPASQWKSGMENCHSLGLSPDQKYVAFICELNGVIVAALK
jgi:hypothetical protein